MVGHFVSWALFAYLRGEAFVVENCLTLAGVNGKCLLPSFAEPLASAPMAHLDGKHPLFLWFCSDLSWRHKGHWFSTRQDLGVFFRETEETLLQCTQLKPWFKWLWHFAVFLVMTAHSCLKERWLSQSTGTPHSSGIIRFCSSILSSNKISPL